MPVEERFITFSLDEVYKSLSIGCAKENLDAPPKGTLNSIEIDEENQADQNSIFLNVKTESGQEERLDFERKFFALSLVFYCQGTGIPLPARGTKTLKMLKDKVIMKIELADQA